MNKQKRKEELEKIIENGIQSCKSWLTSQDGSHGACLDHKGVFKAQKELRELEGEK